MKVFMLMDYQEVLAAIRALPLNQQGQIIVELTGKPQTPDYISLRREQLINKQIGCPHCKSHNYYRYGKDKGSKRLDRVSRKRGGCSSTRGISDDQVAVIVTADRKGSLDMKVATLGRISKIDIENAIGQRIEKDSILCTDGHVSYKGFAIDNQLSLVVLRADLKQHVKKGIYHIQNVNSLHNRVKKWIDSTFWGVSTKYLQNYLNWYRIQETYKSYLCPAVELVKCSTIDMQSKKRFRTIAKNYETLIATHI
jgi:hypothetical protein